MKLGGAVGLAAAIVGSGVHHARRHHTRVAHAKADAAAAEIQRLQKVISDLETPMQGVQSAKEAALQRALAAEGVIEQLQEDKAQQVQEHQRALQQMADTCRESEALHQQALLALQVSEVAKDTAIAQADHAAINILRIQRELQEREDKLVQEVNAHLQTARDAHDAAEVEVNRLRADAEEAAGLRLEVAELLQQVQSQAGLISQATAAKIQAEAEVEEMGTEVRESACLQQEVEQLKQQLLGQAGLIREGEEASRCAQEELRAQSQEAIATLEEQLTHQKDLVAQARDASNVAQEQAAIRLQASVSELQRELDTERNLVLETQRSLSTTQEEVRGLLHRDEGAEGNARVLKGEVASLSAALLRKEDQLSLQAGELHELGTTSATLVSVHQELKGLQKSFQEVNLDKESALATSERLNGRIITLDADRTRQKCQLDKQSSQLLRQATDLKELADLKLKLQKSELVTLQEELRAQSQEAMAALEERLRHWEDLRNKEHAQGLLDRAEGAEGSAQGFKGEVASLSAALLIKEDQLSFQAGKLNEMGTIITTLASVQKQLQTLQKSLQEVSLDKEAIVATSKRLEGRITSLAADKARQKCQLDEQSSQLLSQATHLKELAAVKLKLQKSEAAGAAQQLAQTKLAATASKLKEVEHDLKVATKKRENADKSKSGLDKKVLDLVVQVKDLDERLETSLMQLQEESGQSCYLADQVNLLRAQLCRAGIEPAAEEAAIAAQEDVPEDSTLNEGEESHLVPPHGGPADNGLPTSTTRSECQEAPILKVKLGGGQVAGGGEMGSTPTSVASPQIKVYTPEPAASAAAGSTAESDISTMAAGQSSKGDHDTARVADDDEEGWQEVSKPKKDKSKAQEKQKGGSGKSHRKPSAKKTKPKQGNSSKVLVVRRAKQESV